MAKVGCGSRRLEWAEVGHGMSHGDRRSEWAKVGCGYG